MDYGKAIRIVRLSRLMSQNTLAAKTKLDQSYVSYIESGARQPNTEALNKIAKVLDFPLYLLTLLASENDFKQLPVEQKRNMAVQILEHLL